MIQVGGILMQPCHSDMRSETRNLWSLRVTTGSTRHLIVVKKPLHYEHQTGLHTPRIAEPTDDCVITCNMLSEVPERPIPRFTKFLNPLKEKPDFATKGAA
ncbi:hypothetical protein [Phaeobacter inhibens]|uniref:hypothetical protein n=1 Tax=Phaeobacter inhibens TaxID=221822 RepID=UPI000C9A059C|nr:hypothetical protein [Phaeobacter inhibens]AUQ71051.1 hypothetical protein PhaeoP54_02172 [Phaeobacter inhibens]